MTELEIEQAEKDAREDAEWLLLMVLLAKDVQFRADLGRFYYKGQSVSINQIRGYLNRIERRIGGRLVKLTDDLAKRKITLREWKRGMDRGITSSHILAGALAVGGIAVATRNGDVIARIDNELAYADGFARAIDEGKAGSPKQQSARAKSYLIAATITYGILELIARGAMSKYTECRRIRRASESCPGCIEWAYRWMPIQEMAPISSLQCGSRCRCYLEYR